MLRTTPQLEHLEANFTRERLGRMTYQEALAVFAALWREARALNPDLPGDWREDIEGDLNIARAVNGLPPKRWTPEMIDELARGLRPVE